MAPASVVAAVAFAALSWWGGHGFWEPLAGLLLVFVFLLPLMWLRWFAGGGRLRTRRGVATLAVCVLYAAVGVGIAILIS
jgi:hypothetical protein